uniref:Uncharacterized protein n=1 Tax=Ananas comosus var. bracteatus TaxID=296719 RepID=A0A6V7PCZ1_ANACO|nr:unnamed protein product [Ananas comosus var. bracteatus]
MALYFLSTLANLRGDLLSRHALLLYAATWTAVVTGAVALAAFTPELAFVWAVSPSSPLSQACEGLGPMGLVGSVGLPLDGPRGRRSASQPTSSTAPTSTSSSPLYLPSWLSPSRCASHELLGFGRRTKTRRRARDRYARAPFSIHSV